MKRKDYSQHHSHNGVEHVVPAKSPKKKKNKIYFLGLFLVIMTLLFLVIFKTAFFELKKIVVTGALSSKYVMQVERLTIVYLADKQKNLFLFDEQGLVNFLNQKLELEKLEIKTKLPNKILIDVNFKLPALLWQEGENYYLIDKQGLVETQINLSQLEWDLPKVSAATTTNVLVGQNILSENLVYLIENLDYELKRQNLNLTSRRFIVPDLNGGDVRLLTTDGWYVLFNIQNNIEQAVSNLKQLLQNKFIEDKPSQYIDLRLGDRIFYK